MELSSSSGSSKRAKALGNINHVISCLVDGCNSDLSQCREYHRRHKVCELHSKTPKVTIGGREQRFCQQCSRFHSLVEFDEGKRSCRKRLDGHNRRRRKPQSESFPRTSGMFLSGQQGTRILSFSSPHLLPSGVVSSTWPGAVKTENDSVPFDSHPSLNYIDRQNSSFLGSSAHSYKGVNQFQFLQGTDHILPGVSSICQSLLDPNSASGNSGNSQKMFSQASNRVGNSHRALSLLSSPPPQTRDIGSSRMVQPDPTPQAQSLSHNLHFSSLGQYPFTQEVESKPGVSENLDSNATSNTTLYFQGMFQNGLDGPPSTSGAQQKLSFRWE